MELLLEIIKFAAYSLLIVGIAKYILVKLLRKLAESLQLKPRTVGNIAGIATSVPELLTVTFSSLTGLVDTSVYNILSSNIINLIQYIASVFINKNRKYLTDKVIRVDLGLVIATILIPIALLLFNITMNISIVPIFSLLFFAFYIINTNLHKLHLKKQDEKIDQTIVEEEKWIKGKKSITIRYMIYLILTGILLFFVGNLLSDTLENLSIFFRIPQFVLGIALGFITSLPELITFFESQKHYKKENDNELGMIEATNNLLTSNVLNLFVIQTVGILVYTFFRS